MAKDDKVVATQQEVHAVMDTVAKLGKDFARLNERMRKLESNIGNAHADISKIRAVSEKIVERFSAIKKIRLPKQ